MNLNLEEINKEYVQLNKDLKQIKSEIDDLKAKIDELADDRDIQKGKAIEAKRNGDSATEKTALDEVKRIEDELNKIIEDATNKKDKMKNIQTEINGKIEQIKQDSNMKKHLDDVIAKKHERKIPKLEKEKAEVQAKKGRLENLQQLVKEHPSLENNLKGTLIAEKEISNLEEELDKLTVQVANGLIQYTDPARANEIMNKLLPEAKDKLKTNNEPLMAYITKKGLDITEQDIKDLASTKFAVDHKGNLLLNDTIEKDIHAYNRQIKGYDKSIRNHQIVLDKLEKTYNKQEEKVEQEEIEEQGQNEKEEPKLKWYQKITQIFKNLKEKRKQKALPEATSKLEEKEEIKEEKEEIKEEKEETPGYDFKNSLKYDIVKDIVEQMNESSTKAAKADRKAEMEAKTNEDERD